MIWVKLWCLCSSDVYFLHAKPYCENNTNLPETGLIFDVVLGMIEKFNLNKWSVVTVDYFFTTLPLLEKLTHMDMYGVSTIQENRLQGAPPKKKASLQKETRGTYDYPSDGKKLLIVWRELPEIKLPLLPPSICC